MGKTKEVDLKDQISYHYGEMATPTEASKRDGHSGRRRVYSSPSECIPVGGPGGIPPIVGVPWLSGVGPPVARDVQGMHRAWGCVGLLRGAIVTPGRVLISPMDMYGVLLFL